MRAAAIVVLGMGMTLGGCHVRVPHPSPAHRIHILRHGRGALDAAPVDLSRTVEEVMARVGPSVVQLSAAMPQKSLHEPLRGLEGDPFTVVRAGPLGSGVVVGHNLVLTSQHVVAHAGELRARLSDGRIVPAAVIARDAAHDLALLQLRGDALPLRPIAVGAPPHAGETVLAVGNLYGMEPTVTIGVVSAADGAGHGDTIETDAAINLTNTGGPIVNMRGELVGIANAKLTEQRAMRGLSYATSAAAIGPLITGLKVGDQPLRDRRAELRVSALRGIATEDIDPGLRQRYGISESLGHGAVVTAVEGNSPAAAVGIEPGDVVVEVDFVPVLSSGMFRAATTAQGPLLLLVVRGNTAAYVLVHP